MLRYPCTFFNRLTPKNQRYPTAKFQLDSFKDEKVMKVQTAARQSKSDIFPI